MNRVSVVRELAKYMNSVGEQAYLLPLQLTKKTGRHIPYIYSKEDLSKLFKEMDSLQPSLRSPTKHLVVSVIFRMIYCCGLRPVEARRLRREDVNLFDGTVNILESKGHKDRIVVLSEDMRELCRNYDQRVEAIHPERRYFFRVQVSEVTECTQWSGLFRHSESSFRRQVYPDTVRSVPDFMTYGIHLHHIGCTSG